MKDLPFIVVKCPVRNMIIRKCLITRTMDNSPRSSLIETIEEADIQNMVCSGIVVQYLNSLISHKSGKIANLMLSDIMWDKTNGTIVEENGGILNRIYKSGVLESL